MADTVVLIGLDGVDLDLLSPWIDAGELPNIERILVDGASGELETCPPSWTIPNWNVITTGKTPGKLGIYDFMHYHKQTNSLEPYFTSQSDGTPLWRYIGSDGGRSCVANLPSLHTPEKMDGKSVVGWLPSDDSRLTYPESVQAEIEELVGDYRLDVNSVDIDEGEVSSEYHNAEEFMTQLLSMTEDRMAVFDYLFDDEEWDFFMPVFIGTDRINHALWEKDEQLCRYYKLIDDWIGECLDKVDEDTVVGLVSDHGFRGHDKTFYINQWLEEAGFLRRTGDDESNSTSLLPYLIDAGRQYLPEMIKENVPSSIRNPLNDVAETAFGQANIDWEASTAYCTSVSGTIHINVSSDESDVIEEITIGLIDALTEKGIDRRTFRIHKARDTYSELTGDGPELILELDTVDISTSFYESGNWLVDRATHGNHYRTGFFALHGGAIDSGEYDNLTVTDVAPTVLNLLDSRVPRDMDGEIRSDMIIDDNGPVDADKLFREPLTSSKADSAVAEDTIEDRLESLGYL